MPGAGGHMEATETWHLPLRGRGVNAGVKEGTAGVARPRQCDPGAGFALKGHPE